MGLAAAAGVAWSGVQVSTSADNAAAATGWLQQQQGVVAPIQLARVQRQRRQQHILAYRRLQLRWCVTVRCNGPAHAGDLSRCTSWKEASIAAILQHHALWSVAAVVQSGGVFAYADTAHMLLLLTQQHLLAPCLPHSVLPTRLITPMHHCCPNALVALALA